MRIYRSLGLAAIMVTLAGAPAAAQQEPNSVAVKEEQAGMLRQAGVTPEQATTTALARVPGAVVKSAEIEKEDGRLVYSFDLAVAGREGVEEVLVDATTGEVVSVEHESQAAEAAEHDVPVKVKEEHPGMLKQATITPELATKSALARVPGASVKSAEIERENGRLVYSFDLAVAGKSGVQEVWVDAMTGKVLAVTHENASKEADEEDED